MDPDDEPAPATSLEQSDGWIQEQLLQQSHQPQEQNWTPLPDTEDCNGDSTESGDDAAAPRRAGDPLTRLRATAAVTPDASRYLSALSGCPSEYMARKAARVTRAQVARWRSDPAFTALERAAHQDAAEALLAAAYQRATYGTLTPVYQLGQVVGYRRVYSDRLAEVLLKGLMPDQFREDTKSHTEKQTLIATPEQIAEVVRRLSPTSRPALPQP